MIFLPFSFIEIGKIGKIELIIPFSEKCCPSRSEAWQHGVEQEVAEGDNH